MRLASSCVAILAGLALLIGVAFAANAPAGPYDAILNNTVKITSSAGEEFIYFNKDGTYSATGPGGDEFGRWRIVGNKFCTKARDADESCGLVAPGRSVGDCWEHKLGEETIVIEIIKGR